MRTTLLPWCFVYFGLLLLCHASEQTPSAKMSGNEGRSVYFTKQRGIECILMWIYNSLLLAAILIYDAISIICILFPLCIPVSCSLRTNWSCVAGAEFPHISTTDNIVIEFYLFLSNHFEINGIDPKSVSFHFAKSTILSTSWLEIVFTLLQQHFFS